MAANTHASGSDDDVVEFDRPVDYLLIFVATGVIFELSFDKGMNFITLPAGFHNFKVGAVTELHIQSDGDWQLVGVQA